MYCRVHGVWHGSVGAMPPVPLHYCFLHPPGCTGGRFAAFYLHTPITPALTGGTVFPLADTTDEELLAWRRDGSADKYKQTVTCGPGLAVTPKKGKAIIWYNHKVCAVLSAVVVCEHCRLTADTSATPISGLCEYTDKHRLMMPRALHGGCNVYKGEKWAANHWLKFLPHPNIPVERAKSLDRYGDYAKE
jgi:hypothetical protein